MNVLPRDTELLLQGSAPAPLAAGTGEIMQPYDEGFGVHLEGFASDDDGGEASVAEQELPHAPVAGAAGEVLPTRYFSSCALLDP